MDGDSRLRLVSDAVVELDRVWNPCDPMEPHIRLLQSSGGVLIEVVPYRGQAFVLSDGSVRTVARTMYAFAQEYASYRQQYAPDDRYAELGGQISDLEQETDYLYALNKSLMREADLDAEFIEVRDEIMVELREGLESALADSDTNVEALRAKVRALLDYANERERTIGSDGCEN